MTEVPGTRICLVAALPAEARPLRRHFRLERDQRHAERSVYRGQSISLVISGPGRQAARETVAWAMKAGLADAADTWINPGIGGHASHPLGRVVVADEVEEASSGRRWRCDPPASDAWATGRVTTLDAPGFDYRPDAVYDMEAAGFLEALEHIAVPRRVYCFKVISDNAAHDAREINGRLVSRLLGESIPALERLLEQVGQRR